jgi:folate-binding protein YgfZ
MSSTLSDAGKSLRADYDAIHERAALVVPEDRARIAVSGRDRATYLQGLLTNDIVALGPGSGCYAAWLTPQGRMTTDMHVLESGDMILLSVPAATRESVLQRLDQFIFTEDVQLGDLTATLAEIDVHGPRAAGIIEATVSAVAGLSTWAEYTNARVEFAGSPLVIARIDRLGVPGYTVYADFGQASDLTAALGRSGAVRVSAEAVEIARVEAGYPLFGVDMNDDIIPLEAGIEKRALSMTKGCYVGQEVIIRVLHRGHGRVVRHLVGLRVKDGMPMRDARIYAGGRDIGFITSSAVSPRFGPIALAYVHRDFVEPGTAVEVETASGRAAASVSALPFGSSQRDQGDQGGNSQGDLGGQGRNSQGDQGVQGGHSQGDRADS